MGKVSVSILAGAVVLLTAVIVLGRLSSQENLQKSDVAANPLDAVGPASPSAGEPEASPSAVSEQFLSAPIMQINLSKKYTAIFNTSEGTMSVQLNPQAAPLTVNNFVFLARKHFYDNTIFHRVVKNFMIQGGDPQGTGMGGPGYTLPAEIKALHKRGSIAMARQGDAVNPKRESSGSQFYIAQKDLPFLDGQYTVFGQVVTGLNVVDAIASAPVGPSEMGEMSKPENPVVLRSVEIIEK